MTDDPAFLDRVRAKQSAPFPVFTRTIGQAIDAIHDLPQDKQQLPHWQQARHALYEATDRPNDAETVKAAEAAFRNALRIERWLD